MHCDSCNDRIITGEIVNGVAYCSDCVDVFNGPDDASESLSYSRPIEGAV